MHLKSQEFWKLMQLLFQPAADQCMGTAKLQEFHTAENKLHPASPHTDGWCADRKASPYRCSRASPEAVCQEPAGPVFKAGWSLAMKAPELYIEWGWHWCVPRGCTPCFCRPCADTQQQIRCCFWRVAAAAGTTRELRVPAALPEPGRSTASLQSPGWGTF